MKALTDFLASQVVKTFLAYAADAMKTFHHTVRYHVTCRGCGLTEPAGKYEMTPGSSVTPPALPLDWEADEGGEVRCKSCSKANRQKRLHDPSSIERRLAAMEGRLDELSLLKGEVLRLRGRTRRR